ncbi:hypothetical protein BMF16_13655 [Staphylococcus aureus]|nr:hypothetical protein BMF16_13655 [Staphylococcus aureus]
MRAQNTQHALVIFLAQSDGCFFAFFDKWHAHVAFRVQRIRFVANQVIEKLHKYLRNQVVFVNNVTFVFVIGSKQHVQHQRHAEHGS